MSQIFPETVAASSNGTPCFSKLLIAFRMSQENIYCIYTNCVSLATIFWNAWWMFLASGAEWDSGGAHLDLLPPHPHPPPRRGEGCSAAEPALFDQRYVCSARPVWEAR